jgi:hypothetical protein
MKVYNWCRKLSATLVAGGSLLIPMTASAANLGQNLVVNGDFENVDVNTLGAAYNSPKILTWTGANLFAYSHDGSTTSGGVVPDYADGTDPPGAGHWYFSSNNTGVSNPTDVHDPGVYFQDIDVSAGATGASIAAGTARYSLQAYMSSYLTQADYGNVRAEFRNSGGTALGSATISDQGDAGPDNVWNLTSASGAIPVGTATVRMSLWGFAATGGADGYIDNVSFVVTNIPEPSTGALAGLGFAAAGLGLRRRRS